MIDETKNTSPEKVKSNNPDSIYKPTAAFKSVAWVAFGVGVVSYFIGLWNAQMELNEKGYYFTVLMLGLFAVITVQKNVRDRLEDLKISDLYYSISWFGALLSVALLVVGLWNASLELSEKGFFGIAFILSLFSVIVIQKNVRDNEIKD